MPYIIYRHLNTTNGKSYVGQVVTHKGITSRWKRHICDAEKGSDCIFHRAIRHYGTDDSVWKHEVLQIVETLAESNEAEIYWIRELNTNSLIGGHGYNMTNGGEGVSGYIHSKERREKISKANKGKLRSETTKARMRKSKSEEHREKLKKCLAKGRDTMAKNRENGIIVYPEVTQETIARLKRIAQLPHVKEAKRQAQLRRWKKFREEKEKSQSNYADNTTEITRFNLFDDLGAPSMDAVFERVKV